MWNIAFRTSWIRLLIQSIVAPALLLTAGCGRGSAPRHVIFLLLDAARPDRFSCYGYDRPTTPHVDSLAAHGWLFENHFTHDTDTRSALPPLFYSRYFAKPMFPLSSGIPLEEPENLFRRNDDESMSLPRVLSVGGYRTAAISAHPWITRGTALADEFQEVIDLSDFPGARGRMPHAQEMIDRAITWLDRNRNADYFLYVHLMDTHFPHAYGEEAEALAGPFPAGSRRFDKHGRPRNPREELSLVQRRYLDAMYDGSLKYTDRAIGRLVAHLRRNGVLNRTLIVITSDHGEHLLEHVGRFEHGGPWYDTLARIPLIISYGKHTKPRRIYGLTEAVDLLPTILRLLNVSIPRGISPDGTDLTALIRRGEAKSAVFMHKGIRTATHKLLLDKWRIALDDDPADVETLRGQLYDLAEDPNELHDDWSAKDKRVGELVERYRGAMRRRFDRFQSAVAKEQPRSAFAVSAKDFHVDPKPLIVSIPMNQDAYWTSRKMREWILSDHWEEPWLLGEAGAPPVTIRFALPNGIYNVSMAMAGRCSVFVKGLDEAMFLEGLPIKPSREVKCRPHGIGTIDVENESFEATVRPGGGEGWILLKHLGFEPVVEGARQLDDEAMNRLRALGYLN